jgi:hypothetical protein
VGVISTFGGVILGSRAGRSGSRGPARAIGWGIVDALIALFAGRPNSKSFSGKALHRILLFNAGLDVLYMLGGLSLARTKGAADEKMRGQGWGIVLQGLFLFKFDLIHGLLAPHEINSDE